MDKLDKVWALIERLPDGWARDYWIRVYTALWRSQLARAA
jgi:hypothetical protein